MRLLSPWAMSFVLIALAGCAADSNDDTSFLPVPPDNQAPDDDGSGDDGSGDDGSGDDGSGDDGSGDDDSGDDDSGDDGSGDDGELPDCGYTDPLEITPAITLGNTNDTGTYQLEHYQERTDLTENLTGTWVMMHRHIRLSNSSSGRDTEQLWQKSVFIIRNHSDKLEVASCSYGGFTELTINDDQITLPLFGDFELGNVSFTAATGSITDGSSTRLQSAMSQEDSDNNTDGFTLRHSEAIKVSDLVSPLGQSSATIDGNSINNTDVFCFTQKRDVTTSQDCGSQEQTHNLIVSLQASSVSDVQELFYVDPVYAISSNEKILGQQSTPSVLDITTSHSQITVQVDLTDGVIIPNDESGSGSLTLNLTLPGAVIP
ncbi:MAG: hypothetical protein IBX52_11455 [Bacterioplanes sp.]|nr:hypothetical protein [Bacterioplanes sp.]